MASAIQRRAAQAVIGSLVADAAVSPLHWNYDREKLDGHLAEAKGKPEFFKWSVPFYTLSVGAFSCYGDQALTTLQSLVENKGFDLAKYAEEIVNSFGPSSPYKDPNPKTKEEMPKKGPWLNSSVSLSLDNLKAGKYDEGADQAESDCYTKIIPIVALYAGNPKLSTYVEQCVRTTLKNDRSVSAAVAYSQLLEKVILTGEMDIQGWYDDLPANNVKDEIKAVLAKKDDKNHNDVVKGFGIACSLPGNLQGGIHCLLQGKNFTDSVRLTLGAGGGNCARAMGVGALLAAKDGGEVPSVWLEKMSQSAEVVKLAESLSKLRE